MAGCLFIEPVPRPVLFCAPDELTIEATMMKKFTSVVVLATMLLSIGGCASAKVNPTMTASKTLPRPDVLIVHDFAVTPSDVQLDKGFVATVYRGRHGPASHAEGGHRRPHGRQQDVRKSGRRPAASRDQRGACRPGGGALRAPPPSFRASSKKSARAIRHSVSGLVSDSAEVSFTRAASTFKTAR